MMQASARSSLSHSIPSFLPPSLRLFSNILSFPLPLSLTYLRIRDSSFEVILDDLISSGFVSVHVVLQHAREAVLIELLVYAVPFINLQLNLM